MKTRLQFSIVSVILTFVLVACSSTRTQIGLDTNVGSRIGQIAITQAMDNAFANLDISALNGKRVFTEVTYLGDSENTPFYKAYLANKIFVGGGRPVDDVKDAEVRCLLLIKVGGIDEKGTNYYIVSTEFVQSQFEALVTLSNAKSGELIKTQTIFGQSKVKRSGI
jgi:hypothetical protein